LHLIDEKGTIPSSICQIKENGALILRHEAKPMRETSACEFKFASFNESMRLGRAQKKWF